MTKERKPREGWKCFQFVLSCFLYLVKSTTFQCREEKIWLLPTLMNFYRLLQRFTVILTHGQWFLGPMLIFWGLCYLLCLKLCLKHPYLLCLNLIWVCYVTAFSCSFTSLHSTHTWRITIFCLVHYKHKWDLSNSTDVKKYRQILCGGNR